MKHGIGWWAFQIWMLSLMILLFVALINYVFDFNTVELIYKFTNNVKTLLTI